MNKTPQKPPTPQTPQSTADQVDVANYAVRLRRAIVKISEFSSTQLRSQLDAFLRHIHPTLADKRDTMFPHTVRQHPTNPEHCTQSVWGSVLCFHVGNAILGFYDLILAGRAGRDMQDAAVLLSRRIDKLDEIAAKGVINFYVQGDDRTGYWLISKDELRHG